jgi:alkylation response protein AidB-like acyl-CoA dehydrogenase
MVDQAHLAWPFFEERHRTLARQAQEWVQGFRPAPSASGDGVPPAPGRAGSVFPLVLILSKEAPRAGLHVDDECKEWVRQLGHAGFLRHAIAGSAHGAAADHIDTRAICLLREVLAWHHGLADFAFAMQGLGSGAISLHGTPAQRGHYLPRVARGKAIAAFALSEPNAGSDVAALACEARAVGDAVVLNGEKTWISNGGIADFYVVFARDSDAPPLADGAAPVRGSRGISAFIVDADTPGLEIVERIDVIAPHPLARLRFTDCRVSASQRLGAPGEGFKIAMQTLDIFRTSVAAAALGFARRALHEGLERARSRAMFGQHLADFQLTQAKLAQMATTVDSIALLTYRAAWQRDQGRAVTREAAMAKMAATEGAQQVIDAAVQLFGGDGVRSGQIVESLYREIRALRIYEGATEVQQLIIGRELLREPLA